jgi:hypothetical protein
VTDRTSRRQFLLGAGAFAAAGGTALVACGNDKKPPAPTTETTVGPTGSLSGDLQIAALAASLENLTAATYQMGLDATATNKFGGVPPAIVTFFQTAKRHHEEHAAAWNAILTSAGKTRVTDPDVTLKPQIDQAFGQVHDFFGLARLALSLENVAAATYLSGIGVIQNNQALKAAASIHPVEMQHAAVLNFVLGNDPAPEGFAKTEGARPPSDYPG